MKNSTKAVIDKTEIINDRSTKRNEKEKRVNVTDQNEIKTDDGETTKQKGRKRLSKQLSSSYKTTKEIDQKEIKNIVDETTKHKMIKGLSKLLLTPSNNLNAEIDENKPQPISECDLISELIKKRKEEIRLAKRAAAKKKALSSNNRRDSCPLAGEQTDSNSDINLEVESSIVVQEEEIDEVSQIIIGEKIFKHNQSQFPDIKEKYEKPLRQDKKTLRSNQKKSKMEIISKEKEPETEEQGVLKYALSERKFINKGWTMLPTEKVIRKMHVYRMRPSHPEFDWFENNKAKGQMVYKTGEKLAEFIEDGGGRLFYKTGKLALDYYKAEESNVRQRYVVYSDEEVNDNGRSQSRTILATFDFLGNGVVFDHAGKIRLKYNQTEGVVLDRSVGPASHWKWHTLNDPPELRQVMLDTKLPVKDPRLFKITQDHGDSNKAKRDQSRDDDMLAIEFNNFIKEKNKKIKQTFKPFQVKLKALKINEKFSLRILDQATVYLIFRDGPNGVKMNIGMVLDQKEILDTVTAEVSDCSVSIERFPAGSESVAALQRAVAGTQLRDRARARRKQRFYPSVAPAASADRLWTMAAASRPPRLPLITCSCTISTIQNIFCPKQSQLRPNRTVYSVVRPTYG